MEKHINRLLMLFEVMGCVLNIILLLAAMMYSVLVPTDGGHDTIFWAAVISFIFCDAVNLLIGMIWAYVAKHHIDYMGQFFTAASGIRFLGVLMVLGACFLVVGREAMAPYALTLMLFYLFNVGLHTVFFSHISKKLL